VISFLERTHFPHQSREKPALHTLRGAPCGGHEEIPLRPVVNNRMRLAQMVLMYVELHEHPSVSDREKIRKLPNDYVSYRFDFYSPSLLE
jgi:hypothetical protein